MFIVITIASAKALAFSYEEHASVTFDGMRDACQQVQKQPPNDPQVRAWANSVCIRAGAFNEYVASCIAHMTALAGDYVSGPEAFASNEKLHYLYYKDKDVEYDCQDVASKFGDGVAITMQIGDLDGRLFLPEDKLFAGGLQQFLKYLDFVSKNTNHFQPASRIAWSEWTESMRQMTTSDTQAQTSLGRLAFALHFLEDSFAAGHIGQDRKVLVQDYSQAYHDDMNGTGRFLRDSHNQEWYGYGDKHLDTSSWYVRLDDNPPSRKELESYVEEELGAQLSYKLLEDTLEISSALPDRVALSVDRNDVSAWCYFMDNCDKVELIFVKGPFAEITEDCPREPKLNQVRKCESTRVHVQRAVALMIERFLRGQAFDDAGSDDTLNVIEDLIPTEYRSISSTEKSLGGINKGTFLLTFGEPTSTAVFEDRTYTDWGLSLQRILSEDDRLSSLSLGWVVKVVFPRDREESSQAYRWFNRSCWVAQRIEVVDDDANVADGYDLALSCAVGRVYRNAIGANVKVPIGVDNVWQGSNNRNWYYGVGLGADIHVGKHIVYFDVDYLRHQGEGTFDESGLRLMFGVRGASVDLRPHSAAEAAVKAFEDRKKSTASK